MDAQVDAAGRRLQGGVDEEAADVDGGALARAGDLEPALDRLGTLDRRFDVGKPAIRECPELAPGPVTRLAGARDRARGCRSLMARRSLLAALIVVATVAWRRPSVIPLLALVAVAMLVFALLDAREVVHRAGEANTGLTVLAAAIAALHLAAAAIATLMVRNARRDDESPGPAATMRA
jgi:hypothetical protein